MNKLQLINRLLVMLKSNEVQLEDTKEAECILQEIVCKSVRAEIWEDITNLQTGYYAPDYNSWKEFLERQKNGNADYAAVLQEFFSEEDIEAIWGYSHIDEELSEAELKCEIGICMGQLKMLAFLAKEDEHVKNRKQERLDDVIRARIKGLYNLLYEE